MATAQPNQFTQYNLTDEEAISGAVLNHNQLMVLQNLRAEYALNKVRLKFDPNNKEQYLQEEAEIHGWLNCLDYILQQHDENSENLITDTKPNQPQSDGDYKVFHG